MGECDDEQLARTVVCGEGVTCKGFGGEGTGRKSMLDTDALPVPGVPYHFVTHARAVGSPVGSRVQYAGYVHADALGGWRLLSVIEVSAGSKDWRLSGMGSFVEQWTASNTLLPRGALFGPSFVSADAGGSEGTWAAVPRATFSTNKPPENHEHINAWQEQGDGANGGAVGIETGGAIEQSVDTGTSFDYPAHKEEDSALLADFRARIPCLLESEGAPAGDAKRFSMAVKSKKGPALSAVPSDGAFESAGTDADAPSTQAVSEMVDGKVDDEAAPLTLTEEDHSAAQLTALDDGSAVLEDAPDAEGSTAPAAGRDAVPGS